MTDRLINDINGLEFDEIKYLKSFNTTPKIDELILEIHQLEIDDEQYILNINDFHDMLEENVNHISNGLNQLQQNLDNYKNDIDWFYNLGKICKAPHIEEFYNRIKDFSPEDNIRETFLCVFYENIKSLNDFNNIQQKAKAISRITKLTPSLRDVLAQYVIDNFIQTVENHEYPFESFISLLVNCWLDQTRKVLKESEFETIIYFNFDQKIKNYFLSIPESKSRKKDSEKDKIDLSTINTIFNELLILTSDKNYHFTFYQNLLPYVLGICEDENKQLLPIITALKKDKKVDIPNETYYLASYLKFHGALKKIFEELNSLQTKLNHYSNIILNKSLLEIVFECLTKYFNQVHENLISRIKENSLLNIKIAAFNGILYFHNKILEINSEFVLDEDVFNILAKNSFNEDILWKLYKCNNKCDIANYFNHFSFFYRQHSQKQEISEKIISALFRQLNMTVVTFAISRIKKITVPKMQKYTQMIIKNVSSFLKNDREHVEFLDYFNSFLGSKSSNDFLKMVEIEPDLEIRIQELGKIISKL